MRLTSSSAVLAVVVFSAFLCPSIPAENPLPTASPADRAEAREIFKQLIEINTTDTPKGSVTAASVAMQKRFLDAGFPAEDVHLLGPDPNKQNLVVRMRASGSPIQKPVLFLCHIAVVEARCRYKAPARYDDEVIVRTQLKNVRESLVHFGYELVRATDGLLLAEGETTHVVIDRELKKTAIPDKYMTIFQEAIGRPARSASNP